MIYEVRGKINEWSEPLYRLFTNYVEKILITLKGTLPWSSVKLKAHNYLLYKAIGTCMMEI